jgi:hypothetical protein
MAIFYTDTASIEILSVTNLTAQTSSIQYFTSSQFDVGTNLITLNTTAPLRYGGIAVADSGSSPILSGSLLFDSQNNQWIYIHQNIAGSAITSSVLIMGPQTFNDVGNEITITANLLTKGQAGDLGEHITSSNVTDTGTLVSINSNTEVTGSFIVTSGITGSLLGTAATASYVQTAQTASYVQTAQTASYVLQAVSASYATTASYLLGGGAGTPGGLSGEIQYNNSSTFGGVPTLTYDGTTLRATGSFTGSFTGDGSGLTNLPSTSGTNIGTVLAITRVTYPFSGF